LHAAYRLLKELLIGTLSLQDLCHHTSYPSVKGTSPDWS
jgi:hypothetical protein